MLGTRTKALSVLFPLSRIAPLSVAITHGKNIVSCLLHLCSLSHPLHTTELTHVTDLVKAVKSLQ